MSQDISHTELLTMSDPGTILLAEDRDDDILLIQRAFKKAGILHPIFVVNDGEQAISYLSGTAPYLDRKLYPFPILFLLDLALPGTSGFDVLRWIRTRPELKDLPVVVLTQSERIRDVNEAYKLGAYSFIMKSADFQDAVTFAQSMFDYWSKIKKTTFEPLAHPWPPKENPLPYVPLPQKPANSPRKPSSGGTVAE